MSIECNDGRLNIDEIDRQILEILADNPRQPYADIADELAENDIQMSSEGVRRRVTTLFDNMTSFFLPRPEKNSWELVVVTVRTEDGPQPKRDAFEAIAEMNFWFVAYGFGTVDVYAIATAPSNTEINALLAEVRGLETVVEMDHFIETDRAVNISNYLPVN
ncbi:Lrp/AsnC family transcriptional regulator [Salinadaptatus halalkaliphilus]|uniref:Lrp/AsnC family transcriptional regulator n=1 Tax=Salinadaptatus halalkaliphilus TaxID=2419781 RepID=A0A4V3VL22_9EURY|nr:Lrp/AsnC family transcriptional regulator [Salinadaptatus halalkaliphilus]THE64017.1 Lrp/AsnC family transcriptional regulator [Salinadaptatus halalkaliphilus]